MRAIVGWVMVGLALGSHPALARCYGKGATLTCIDEAGNVTVTTDTGNGTIKVDPQGNVMIQTPLKNGSLSTSGDGTTTVQTHTGNTTITTGEKGDTTTETQFDKGAIVVGASPNGDNAWSQTTIRSGGTVMTQTEKDGKVVTEMEQVVGGGYVLRSTTDSDGKTTNLTCGPGIGCK